MPPRHSSSLRVPHTSSPAGRRRSRTTGGPQGFGQECARSGRGRDISISVRLSALFLGRLFLCLREVGGGFLGYSSSTGCAVVDLVLTSAVSPCPLSLPFVLGRGSFCCGCSWVLLLPAGAPYVLYPSDLWVIRYRRPCAMVSRRFGRSVGCVLWFGLLGEVFGFSCLGDSDRCPYYGFAALC